MAGKNKTSFSVFTPILTTGSKSYDTLKNHQTHKEDLQRSLILSKTSLDVDNQLNSEKRPKRKYAFRMVYVSAVAAMLHALCTGYSNVYAGPATFDMQTRRYSRIKVTDEEVSWIGSMVPIGAMAAIPLTVYLADRIGRKETLILNTVTFVISWLVTIYAPNAFFVTLGRLIGGWAAGVVHVVLPMYAVEISSADTRGLIGGSFHSSVSVGGLLAMGLGAILTWAWLAVGGLIAVVIALIVFAPMPESPRWLVACDMKDKAIGAIEFLHADKIDAKQEYQIIKENLEMRSNAKYSIQNFLQPIIYKPALISMGQMVFVTLSGSAVVVTFSSMILANAGSSVDPKNSTVIVGIVRAVVTIASTLVVDKVGRRPLLLISGFLMGISHVALGSYFYFYTLDNTISSSVGWLPLASLLFYIAMFSLGYGPVPWLMLSEMVPTRERGFISGVATFLLFTLDFVVMKTFENIKNIINFHGAFWTYSVFCFLGCFFVYFLVPETKKKQLEEIQLLFSGSKTSKTARRTMQKMTKNSIDNPAFLITIGSFIFSHGA